MHVQETTAGTRGMDGGDPGGLAAPRSCTHGQLSVGSGGYRQGVEARSHYGIEEQSLWTQATPRSSPGPAPHHPSVDTYRWSSAFSALKEGWD